MTTETQPTDSNAMPVEHQIVAAIRQIVRAVDLQSRRLLESHNLTGPQLATLHEIARRQPASPSTIARAVHLSPGTVTGILQRLERQGLITRRPSQTDRRAVIIDISPAGRDTLASAPSLLQDRFKHELERLEDWERSMILATLQRVAQLMGAEQIDASPHLLIEELTAPGAQDPSSDAASHGADGARHAPRAVRTPSAQAMPPEGLEPSTR